MFRFIVLASVLAICVQGQYHSDPKQVAIISEQRYLSGNGKFGAAYVQEDGTDFKEEVDEDGTRHGSYSYIDPTGEKRTISYTAGKNGFVPSGSHLPQPPPAPAHAQLAAVQAAQYNTKNSYDLNGSPNVVDENGFETGEYDPRYNDPNFSGNFRSLPAQSTYSQPAQQPQYHVQPEPAQPAPQPQPQYNTNNVNYGTYQTTTPYPEWKNNRFQPPGKLSLSRTPDGFSYSFNKV